MSDRAESRSGQDTQLSEHAPLALIDVDPDGRIRAANPGAEALFGFSRRNLIGRPLGKLVVAGDQLLQLMDYARESQADIASPGVTLKPAGLSEQTEVTVRLRPLADGGVVVALSSPLNRAVEDHIPGVASFGRILGHEIKNPLAGISGAAQLLLRKGRSDERELLELVCDECSRIERLVNRLSTFELFSSPQLRPLNIHQVLDRVLASEEAAFDGKLAFARRYDPSLPDIPGDADHLHEAFQNIVRNACEAALANSSERAPRVELRTAFETRFARRGSNRSNRLRRAIRVDVIDTGAGVDTAQLPNVFDAFTSSKSAGRGLGLTVVKEVINAHSGQVEINSGSDGTRMSVFLPMASGGSNVG